MGWRAESTHCHGNRYKRVKHVTLGGSGARKETPATPGQVSGNMNQLGCMDKGKGLGKRAGLSPSGTNPAVHLRRSLWRPVSPGSWKGQAVSCSTLRIITQGTGMMGLTWP